MSTLTEQKCLPCEGGIAPLEPNAIAKYLSELSRWEVTDAHKRITKTFNFDNYYETIAFVNAIAWLSHLENHHPDLEVSYQCCRVSYTTHAIDGLSINDFVCAAKVDKLRAGL